MIQRTCGFKYYQLIKIDEIIFKIKINVKFNFFIFRTYQNLNSGWFATILLNSPIHSILNSPMCHKIVAKILYWISLFLWTFQIKKKIKYLEQSSQAQRNSKRQSKTQRNYNHNILSWKILFKRQTRISSYDQNIV